jgi:hypothetical protein
VCGQTTAITRVTRKDRFIKRTDHALNQTQFIDTRRSKYRYSIIKKMIKYSLTQLY